MNAASPEELVESYLQADAPGRVLAWKDFLAALATLAREDETEKARSCAARAVSPDLDYSSLRSLRKYVLPPGRPAEGIRLAVLGGPTTSQLADLLDLFLAGAGVSAQLYQGEYGLFRQEILAPGSSLDRFKPQIVFFATNARDISRLPGITAGRGETTALLDAEVDDWKALWRIANERWGATVLQNTFDTLPLGAFGHHAIRLAAERSTYTAMLNRAFADGAPPYVVLHDLELLVTEMGAPAWFDPRFYFEAKMPCGPECLATYAHSVASLVRAIVGRSKKVLVLDLDNTLWGGTVGDLGSGGITLGQGSGEGEAFLAFQQYAKELHDRGIVLAVCSKNDEAHAREPFEQRRDMVLKLGDISCFIANWRDKAENLREIANRLDLGIDSLVFVDDNPAERALVRRLLPAVAVPDMPEDPAGFIAALAHHRYFETTSFTQEDTRRSQYYADNAQRKAMASSAAGLDSFLASLDMKARVEPVGPLNIERVTQLINKSNQFNLTTRRHTLAEVQAIVADPAWRTLTISLKDKLGDNGLISVLLLRKAEKRLDIDTWLMSCRVLQRGVEQLALNQVVELARATGCDHVSGTYIPTERNSMVRDHFAMLHFAATGAHEGRTTWLLPIAAFEPFRPHIALET